MAEQKTEKKTQDGKALVILSLLASFAFFFYAPCMLYFPNAEEFVFTFYDIWWILLLCFLTAAMIFYAVGRVFPKIGPAWCGLLFAFGIMVYLQGSFLSEDMGRFNGLAYDWQGNIGRIVLDGVIWIAAAAICIYAASAHRKSVLKIFSGLGFAVLVFLAVTTGVLMLSSKKEYLQKNDNFVTDREELTVSTDRNVILLVLDMFDSSYMETILEEDPGIAARMDGFTFFSNATSNFGATNYSLGSFLSGSLMLNQKPVYSETLNANYESDVFFPRLLENGYSVGIYTEGKFIPDALSEKTVNCLRENAGIADIPSFLKAVYRMAGCTFLPDAARPFLWLRGDEFDGLYAVKDSPYGAYTWDNDAFYRKLQEEGLETTGTPCFRMIHLYGAHYPYITDEYLNRIPPSYSDENAVSAAKGALKIVLDYLDMLKEEKVLDSSLVIVMADHGYSVDGGLTNPLLMVRQPGAAKGFRISDAPVSLFDLQTTILSQMNIPTDGVEGEDMFSVQTGENRERRYYQMFDAASNGQSRLVEYTVSPEGNARKYYRLTDREISAVGEISRHSETCAYCRANGLEPVDAPNSASIIH